MAAGTTLDPADVGSWRTPSPRRRTGPPTFVLLGGVPGAGKTTLLRRLARDRPDVQVVDPDWLRELLGPLPLPYRCYRPLVHTVNALITVLVLLRGPHPAGGPLVVHDPATRPRRRELTGWLARRRGWRPVLVMLDVPRDEALAGQRMRGRVVAAGVFDAHWRRWSEQRSRLSAAADGHSPDGPWARTVVVDRRAAASALAGILR